jgi:HD-GYP domain-containing protein (c-di-GMP phosphodiesterase class II)
MIEAVSTAATTVGLDPAADELIRETRVRNGAGHLERRARFAFLASGTAVAAGIVACLFALDTGLPGSAWRALFFVALYAVATRIEFEIGTGSAVATQVVLVPMLFALPLGLVPLVVALGFVAGSFADSPSALRDPSRILPRIANAAHSLGPVLVLSLAHGLPLRWSAWPIYLGALGAQFAFDFGSAMIGNLGHGIGPRTMAKFVVFAESVDLALAPIGLTVAFATHTHWALAALVLPLLALLRTFAGERRRRIDSAFALSDAYRGTAFLLGDVIEADDVYTGSHSRDVVELVQAVCEELDLPPAERRDAEFAALLHDVGKIRIAPEILNKRGPLDAVERELMQTHAVEGERMLTKVGGLLGHVGHIVRSCHERWDGDGYPDGLAGEAIPLVSRIVCACDAFSAMTTHRPYRDAMSRDEALAELRACAGTHFDPQVVAALLSVA